MTVKSKTIDWGGLTLKVDKVQAGVTKPNEVAVTAPVVVPDAATYTFLAKNSGKVHVVPDLTATCVFSFPTAEAGLTYEVWYGGAAADAQDWNFVLTSGFFIGGVSFLDTDAGAGADEVHLGVYSDGNSNDNFDVVTPAAGTRILFACDGTNWYVNGQVLSATVCTMADA